MSQINIALIEITIGVLFLIGFWWVVLQLTESNKLDHYFKVALSLLTSWFLYVIFMSTTFHLTIKVLYILKYFGFKNITAFFFVPYGVSHFYLVILFYKVWLPYYRQFDIRFSKDLIRANIYFFIIFLSMLNLTLLIMLVIPDIIAFIVATILLLFSSVVSILLTKLKFEWSHVENNFRLIALSFVIILLVFVIYQPSLALASFL